MNWSKIQDLNNHQFLELLGIKKPNFLQLVMHVKNSIQEGCEEGVPPLISIEDQILICFYSLLNKQNQLISSLLFDITESDVSEIINKLEPILLLSPDFQLAKAHKLGITSQVEFLIDKNALSNKRPVFNQKAYYLREKKTLSNLK